MARTPSSRKGNTTTGGQGRPPVPGKIAPLVLDQRLRFADVLAPVPPGAAADYLLLARARDDDLTLLLTCPNKVTHGDVVQLHVRGVATGNEVPVDDYLPDGDIPLVLPATLRLNEGPYALNYVAIYRSGGGDPPQRELGPPNQQFIVDYTPPGGGDTIVGLRFADGVIADGVTAERLVDDGTGDTYLPAIVVGYFGAQPGDTVRGYIDGVAATETVEVRLGEAGSDLPIRFYRAALELNDDGLHAFAFDIEDRAGNRSPMAEPVTLDVRLTNLIPDLLAPPVVRGATGTVDNVISPPDADVDATAIVAGMTTGKPPVAAFTPGDTIQLHWNDAIAGPSVTVVAAGTDVVVTVPAEVIQASGSGVWDVHYTVTRTLPTPPFRDVARSPTQSVTVQSAKDIPGGGDPLKAATFTEANDFNGIGFGDAQSGGGTPVRIHAYVNMAVGDLLSLTFAGSVGLKPGGTPIPEADYATTHRVEPIDLIPRPDDSVDLPRDAVFMDFIVPTDQLVAIQYGLGSLDYTVTNAVGVGTAKRATLYVDTRPPATVGVP